MYTKEVIKQKLATDVRWMERALIVLFRRQTPDEQESDQTRVYNERGFNGVDSRYLSYCAKYILKGGHLSGDHVRKVGKKLPKYWRQIHDEIKSKGG